MLSDELPTSAYSPHDAVNKAERRLVDRDLWWDDRSSPILQLLNACEVVEEESAEENSAQE